LIGFRLAIRLSGLILLDRMRNPARSASQMKQRILGTQPDFPAHENAHERKAGFQVLRRGLWLSLADPSSRLIASVNMTAEVLSEFDDAVFRKAQGQIGHESLFHYGAC
jgi:hypothetical protein